MKWISLITLMLLAGAAFAQDSSDILQAYQYPDLFEEADTAHQDRLKPGSVTLSAKERSDLRRKPGNTPLRLPSLDELTGNAGDSLRFRRIELFSPRASIRHITPSGSTLVEPVHRDFYLATNESTGVALAVEPDSGSITGFVSKNGDKFEITSVDGIETALVAVETLPDGSDSCDTRIDDQPGFDLADALAGPARSMSAATAGSTISYQAEVAVDTDNEWMAGKGNDPVTAMNFITNLFLAMNVFYERDMETHLVIADVTLRTSPDPYLIASGRSDQLDEFAEHWRINQDHVERDFAMMFSGRDISHYYFSGIAWLDQYCRNGRTMGSRTVGSYSFNAIGSGRTAANTAASIGHELGHNMGSPHTHCYSPEVDQCYGSESGCYSGPVSCPTGGKGTIMSYCHYSTASGGADCGTASDPRFHPTVQGLVKNRLAAQSPSCIAAFVEEPPLETPLFKSGFE